MIDPGRLVAERLDVFNIRPGINARLAIRTRFAAKLQYSRSQAAQERAVVGNKNHRPFKAFQRFDEHLLSGKVKVIGGLIEHQEVRRVVQHASHCQTRLSPPERARIGLSTSSPEN